MKWLTPFILFFSIISSLSACGTSWEKPTGLEKTGSAQQENNLENDAEEFKIDEENVNNIDENIDVEEERHSDNNTKDEGSEKHNNKKADENSEQEKAKIEKSNKDGESTTVKNESFQKSNSSKKSLDNKSEQQVTSSNDKKSKKENNRSSNSKSTTNTTKDSEKSSNKQDKNPGKTSDKNPGKKSNQEKPSPPENPESQASEPGNTIVFSIVISSNEVPLAPTEFTIEDGDTVLDALIAITKKYKIQMDYRGGQGSMAYVEGIDNVYEFDRGQGSGWMYRINGIFPDRGVGVVPLMGGDRVEFLYTTDLGEDIGADLQPFRR